MKKLLFFPVLLFLFFCPKMKACDISSASITSLVDNMDGTYTVSYHMCVEFYGLEGSPYGWAFNYNNPNTVVVQSFSPSTITDLDGDVFTGTIRDGNCDAQGDNVYGGCDGVDNVLQYYFPGFLPTNNGVDTLCFNVTMTIMGYPTSVDIVTNTGATSFGSCTKTLFFPVACGISTIAAGTQSGCNPGDNTYTQEVTVTYTSPPASGNVVVNGQTFPITSSPQTVTLTGLSSDGNPVNTTAFFSDDMACTATQNSLFTAPASCGCGANAGTISR